MNYELFMRAALAEADAAAGTGDLADGAVAVMDEAMVARGRDARRSSGDPTAHAAMGAIREASHRLGRPSLAGVSMFCVVEPCVMCTGALLAADIDGVVFALADPRDGACGGRHRLAGQGVPGGRLRVVSGILADEAGELRPDLVGDRRDADPTPARGGLSPRLP
ncbi:MAG: nucleoside deaminase [Chloroflexota bacterium]